MDPILIRQRAKLLNLVLNLLPFVILFLAFLAIHQNIYSFDEDDSYFGSVSQKQSLPEFLVNRYTNWSGRISIEASLYVVLSYHVRVWRLLNSLVLTGFCFSLTILLLGWRFWLQNIRRTWKGISFMCFGLGLLNISVLSSSVFWITGSFNYLWPITAACIAIIPFSERIANGQQSLTRPSRVACVLPLLAAAYAALGNEQVALILFLLMLAADAGMWREHKKVETYFLVAPALVAAGLVIMSIAPGNHYRLEQSLQHAFPNFNQLSLWQHLFLGIQWLLIKTVNLNRILLILLFGLLALSLNQTANTPADRLVGRIAVYLAGFLVVSSLFLDYVHPDFQAWVHELFYSFRGADEFVRAHTRLGQNYNYYLYFIPYLIWIPVFAWLPFGLYRSFRNSGQDGWFPVVLFGAAIVSLVVMFFSPTIYASGNRIVAIYSVILLFITAKLFLQVEDRIPASVLLAIYSLATLNLLFQHLEWSKKYFIHW